MARQPRPRLRAGTTVSRDHGQIGRLNVKVGTLQTTISNQCYYQTDNSSDLSSISNIGSNANFDGPETVNVSGYYAFEIQGPCTWVLVP